MVKPSRPQLTLMLDDQPLTLRWLREVNGAGHEWQAEHGGTRLTIVLEERWRQVRGAPDDPTFHTSSRGDVADLGSVVAALGDAEVGTINSDVAVSVACQWGHFRQNRWGTVTLCRDGDVLHINADISEQDDSYY
jgi:hypothetical protein